MNCPLPPLPLIHVQGSRWTLQAVRMNGKLGSISIQPDQMQALNPILILVFIPIFEIAVYPLFGKCRLLKKYQNIIMLIDNPSVFSGDFIVCIIMMLL